jgi:hypothetical protein
MLVIFIVPTAARQLGWQFDPVGTVLYHVVPWTTRLVWKLAGQGV